MTEIYHVRVIGVLDDRWSEWFNGMEIQVASAADGTSITTLTGPVADQARLRGIVSKIWDLNLTVISVNRIESRETLDHIRDEEVKDGKTVENGMA